MWESIYAEPYDILEYMAVPGGYLYRSRRVAEQDPVPGQESWTTSICFGPNAAPAVIDVPVVTGEAAVGAELTCTMGNWMAQPTAYGYEWESDGLPVAGSGNTYTVADTDAGKSITCIVTAENDEGTTEAPPSNAIAIPP